MECFGTTDFDNNGRLITSAVIISGLDSTLYSTLECVSPNLLLMRATLTDLSVTCRIASKD